MIEIAFLSALLYILSMPMSKHYSDNLAWAMTVPARIMVFVVFLTNFGVSVGSVVSCMGVAALFSPEFEINERFGIPLLVVGYIALQCNV